MTIPKTDAAYWEGNWYARDDVPSRIVPASATYTERKIHELLVRVLAGRRGQSLLEIGCGASRWLPYFAVEHGVTVSGMDYAPRGCAIARQVLDKEGIAGEILHRDALAENPELQGRFDIVFSYGVVEHFSDTAACVAAFARYLKPGGIIVTTVPNVAGAVGAVQQRLERSVYDTHLPITREHLAAAHRAARLDIVESGYLGVCDFHVLNIVNVPKRGLRGHAVHAATRVAYRFSRLVWAVERVWTLRPGRWLAPMVYCVGRNVTPS